MACHKNFTTYFKRLSQLQVHHAMMQSFLIVFVVAAAAAASNHSPACVATVNSADFVTVLSDSSASFREHEKDRRLCHSSNVNQASA